MASLKELQKKQEEILAQVKHPRLGDVVGLYEEVGELSKEVMEIEFYGQNKQKELAEECADVLFSLMSICGSYNIDLQEAYEKKINNIGKKIPDWITKYGNNLASLRKKLD